MTRRLKTTAEDGFVMVITIVVMAIVLAVAAVAIAETQNNRAVTTRDVRYDRALQAAEAGAQSAMYRLNQIQLGNVNFSGGLNALSQAIACQTLLSLSASVSVVGLADASLSTGQCGSGSAAMPAGPIVNAESFGNREQATAYVKVGASSTNPVASGIGHTSIAPVVVSVGRETNGTATTSDDVVRRIEVVLAPIDPFSGIESTGDLTFNSSGVLSGVLTATTVNGNARTNGNLKINVGSLLSTFTNTDISLSPLGVTGSVQYAGTLSNGTVPINLATIQHTSSPPVNRTPVSLASTKPDCSASCPAGYTAGTHVWAPSAGIVTINSGDYVFCRMTVASSVTVRPVITNNVPVRIFIDSPSSSRCSGAGAGAGNITFSGSLNPGVNLQPSQFQVYMAGNGSGTRSTANFDFSTNLLSAVLPGFFFYGPTSDITMKYTTFQGTIVGHDVTMTASGVNLLLGIVTGGFGVFTQDLNVNNLPLTTSLGTFHRLQQVECSPTDVASLSTITSGC